DPVDVLRDQRALAEHLAHHGSALDGVGPDRGALDRGGGRTEAGEADRRSADQDGGTYCIRNIAWGFAFLFTWDVYLHSFAQGCHESPNGYAISDENFAGGGLQLGPGPEEVGPRAGQAEPRGRDLVLAPQHVEVGGTADLEAGALGGEVERGGLGRRRDRLHALLGLELGRLELHDRELDLPPA